MEEYTGKALLIIDLQNDFCPGGSLAVPEGDKIVGTLNEYIEIFIKQGVTVFISRDWHPKKTKHFKKFGGVWPEHCIQNTKGAEFHPCLKLPDKTIVISKGMDPDKESYSAFGGFDDKGVPFIDLLKKSGIKELYIGGLATDYCVKNSVLDALKLGFGVKLLVDAIKGVDLNKGDSEQAVKEMLKNGAVTMSIDKI